MKKLLTISNFILFMFLIVSCRGRNDSITGGNGGGLPPDNREPAQTDTEISKNYLREYFNQYSRGEVIEEGNTTYTFDGNGDMTISHEGSITVTTYKFWGMSPNDNKIAYYYNLYNMGMGNIQASFMPVSYQDEYQYIRGVEYDFDKMKATIFNEDPNKKETDYTKINPPQTSSPKANEWKDKVKTKSITGNYQSDDSAIFTFDNSGNLTIKYKEYEYNSTTGEFTGNKISKTENYTFWGGAEDSGSLYGLYYKDYGSGQYHNYISVAFTLDNNDGMSEEINQSYSENIGLIMHPSKPGPDYSKINPTQTSTAEANKWRNSIKNREIAGENEKYKFDANGNLTITYTYQDGSGNEVSENYIFWGAKEINQYGKTDLYGLYYQDYGSGYSSSAFTLISSGGIKYGNLYDKQLEDIMLGKKTGYDYESPKTSTTTAANEEWKNKVKSKSIKEKYVTIYTFQPNGNVLSSGGQYGEAATYNFWGAIDKTTAIYYEKINIRNIFYNYTIPNSEVWYYYGIKLDTIDNKFRVYKVSNYDSLLDSWIQNNFDRNGDPKPNIDWSKMPVQRRDNIDWSKHFIEGNLIK